MEKSRGNSKVKNPKAKPSSNENISPMKSEMEDPVFIGRGRFHNSMMSSLSPTFLSYAENLDINSPLARYLRGGGGSPISGKVSPSGESFTSPISGSRKSNRSAILQQYNSSSSGSSSSGLRNRLSVSPLSSIENLEMMTSPVYGTPVKAEEEVLVMDDIQVRLSSSSSGGGKRLMTDVAKKYSNGKEHRPARLSSTHKSEASHSSKSSPGTGTSACGPRNRNIRQFQNAAGSEDAVKTPKPASAVKPEPEPEPDHALIANTTLFNDWSPLDDNIVTVVPQNSPNNNSPSREDIEAYISSVLYGPSTKRRLPVFVELCSEKLSP